MTPEDLLWLYSDNLDIKQMVSAVRGECLKCDDTGYIHVNRFDHNGRSHYIPCRCSSANQ